MCLAANVTVEHPIYPDRFRMQGWNEPLLSSGKRHMTCLTFHHLEASTHKLQRLLILRWRKHVPIWHVADRRRSRTIVDFPFNHREGTSVVLPTGYMPLRTAKALRQIAP